MNFIISGRLLSRWVQTRARIWNISRRGCLDILLLDLYRIKNFIMESLTLVRLPYWILSTWLTTLSVTDRQEIQRRLRGVAHWVRSRCLRSRSRIRSHHGHGRPCQSLQIRSQSSRIKPWDHALLHGQARRRVSREQWAHAYITSRCQYGSKYLRSGWKEP